MTSADAGSDSAQRVQYLVLRFMRPPLFVLLGVYAVGMLGWQLIPGPPDHPEPLSFFHAFYFLTYTATTTGFGEIPYAFSDAQRVWAMVCLYAGVVAWLYAIGAIIRLLQAPAFRRALAERRFAKSVARLNEPFVIVCGFGNRGSLLTRGLSDAGIAVVILDSDEDRINALLTRDYRVPTPALAADARVPDRLIEAGMMRSGCRAVVALTSDEEVNAKIAIAARLLNPEVKVVTQLTRDIFEETLATLGGDLHIIDPFQTFSRYLATTICNPVVHMLSEWIIGAPGASLAMYSEIPKGTWILCGYGRMGRAVKTALDAIGIATVVIDPQMNPLDAAGPDFIVDRFSQSTLIAAGIGAASGIVACTHQDAENLGIALNARALNPQIFILVRQNRHRNEVLFAAARADLIMQPNLVSARRILFLLIAPRLRDFLEVMRDCTLEDRDNLLGRTVQDLVSVVGGDVRPDVWTATIDAAEAPAVTARLDAGVEVTLRDVLRTPHDRDCQLPAVPLVLRCRSGSTVSPRLDRPLDRGDEVLFCGRPGARRLVNANLSNPYTLSYLLSGRDEPRSYVFRWLAEKRKAAAAAAPAPAPEP